jgi:hypothetical protein
MIANIVLIMQNVSINHVTKFNDESACQCKKLTKQDLPESSKSYFNAVCRTFLGKKLQQIFKKKAYF